MALDLKHPVDILGDIGRDPGQRHGKPRQLRLALGGNVGLALREQDLGLEDEPVTDDPHVVAAVKDVAKTPEKFGAEALQLLDPRGKRVVQRLAEAGDGDPVTRRLGFLLAKKRRQLLDAEAERGDGVRHPDDFGLRGRVSFLKLVDPPQRGRVAGRQGGKLVPRGGFLRLAVGKRRPAPFERGDPFLKGEFEFLDAALRVVQRRPGAFKRGGALFQREPRRLERRLRFLLQGGEAFDLGLADAERGAGVGKLRLDRVALARGVGKTARYPRQFGRKVLIRPALEVEQVTEI